MKREIAAILIFCSFLLVMTGCGNRVSYSIAPQFRQSTVNTIAVVPVGGDVGSVGGRRLLREVANEALTRSGYSTLQAEVVDKRLSSLAARVKDVSDGAGRGEIIKTLDADGVLFITVTKWDASLLLYYASIDIGARFELYSRSGKRMWTAEYTLGNADLNADIDYLKFAVHDTYEPMVVNLVERVMATLPMRPRVGVKREGPYDWLP